jgi:hypothetical protein
MMDGTEGHHHQQYFRFRSYLLFCSYGTYLYLLVFPLLTPGGSSPMGGLATVVTRCATLGARPNREIEP